MSVGTGVTKHWPPIPLRPPSASDDDRIRDAGGETRECNQMGGILVDLANQRVLITDRNNNLWLRRGFPHRPALTFRALEAVEYTVIDGPAVLAT